MVRNVAALPQARELSRVLRPLRYGPRRLSLAEGLDEEGTAIRIAQSGVRDLVYKTTRRRRLDVDLVLDVGGSGPLWTQVADELRVVLERSGAFRTVRPWSLDTDAAGLPLKSTHDLARLAQAPRFPAGTICRLPRRPLVMMLTDGAGRGWKDEAVQAPLRAWAGHGTLVLVHLLPEDMWQRTALTALSVTFHPAFDGYRQPARAEVTDQQLAGIAADPEEFKNATAVPVVGLDVTGLRTWLSLLRGGGAGPVPGRALLIPPPAKDDRRPTDPAGAEAGPGLSREEDLSGEERVQRFMLAASRDARRLAQLASVCIAFPVPTLRKLRHELLPDSSPHILAEVMLGGLLRWAPATATEALSGTIRLDFQPDVRELLQERPGGVAEFYWDYGLVTDAIFGRRDSRPRYGTLAGTPGVVEIDSDVSPESQPLIEPLPEMDEAPVPWSRDETSTAVPSVGHDGVDLLRIGVWGSQSSGRTVFLTVLGYLGLQEHWITLRGERWRVVPATAGTKEYIQRQGHRLFDRRMFLDATMPTKGERLSFRLERKRPATRWRRERLANITMSLVDRGGGEFSHQHQHQHQRQHDAAVNDLVSADALLYFFDPTFDLDDYVALSHRSKHEPAKKLRSYDYFNSITTKLLEAAARRESYYQGALPQHIAVCVPKLDEQWVFDMARRYGCMEYEHVPESGAERPWVPQRLARRFFEALTYELGTPDADYLRRGLSASFHPKRISYHALSSVGFWAPGADHFDLSDVCNRIPSQAAVPSDGLNASAFQVRGDINPVHVLDPLISLVERAAKTGRAGWRR